MRPTVDYYFAPQSPWTYLGHARFAAIAKAAGVQVRVLPVDLGKVFPVSGGLPLPKRAPQRQAYRLLELQRFSDFLQLPLHVQPRYFPVAGDDAASLILAVDMHDGPEAALHITGAVLAAVWAQPVTVENREGAGGLIGAHALLALPAEGLELTSEQAEARLHIEDLAIEAPDLETVQRIQAPFEPYTETVIVPVTPVSEPIRGV